MLGKMERIVHDGLARSGRRSIVARRAPACTCSRCGHRAFAGAVAPIVRRGASTGVLANVAQVGLRFSTKALQAVVPAGSASPPA